MKHHFQVILIFFLFVCSGNAQIIQNVYFAQTHVVEPTYQVPATGERFKLISNRKTLIKAHIVAQGGVNAPLVEAVLMLNGNTMNIPLNGPSILPVYFNDTIGQVVHSFEDSFTGVIPKEWMLPNLEVRIQAGTESVVFNDLEIGAPNKMLMTNFEVNGFVNQQSDFPSGWEDEFEEKFPTSELVVQNVPVFLEEISAPPTSGRIAARITSAEDYNTITGFPNFSSASGPQNLVATQWKAALRDAAGKFYGKMKYFHVAWNFENRANKGVGGGYSSVSRRGPNSLGILLHEMGHALSLPHWGNHSTYPYKGDMHGILAPNIYNDTHSGPTWSFDFNTNQFIAPTQSNVTPLTYKNDPMQGGGNRFKAPGFLANHFSDYSVNRMRNMLENHLVIYNEDINAYAKWNNSTLGYTDIQNNASLVNYPIQRNVEVISVMAAASSNTPQANLVYKPIGPYFSGVIKLYDPFVLEDRIDAQNFFCPSGGCDATLKIVQGGVAKYVMLPISLDQSLAQTDVNSFSTRAVNLLASDGEISLIELLDTPNVEDVGLSQAPLVLDTWINQSLSLSNFDVSKSLKIFRENSNKLKVVGLSQFKGNTSLTILSLTGQVLFKTEFKSQNSKQILIPAISEGVYIVNIINKDYNVTKKVIL